MILLTRDTGMVQIDVGPEAVCIRHQNYNPPVTREGCLHLMIEEFARRPRAWMDGRSIVVTVGLNRIITPGNRTAEVFEILFNNSGEYRKISIDHTLFIGEPWRAWFHFGLVGAPYREYTYSYLAESHWKAFCDGARPDDPFALSEIEKWGAGIVRCEYPRYFEPVAEEIVEVDADTHRRYQDLKAEVFEDEHAIGRILARLSRFAQDACPRRSVPTIGRLFDRTAHRIVRTDLMIDEYLVGRLRETIALTDGIAARFHDGR